MFAKVCESAEYLSNIVYLAASVDCERAFSVAGLIHTDRRASLTPATSRELMIVGNWSKVGMLDRKAFLLAVGEGDKGKGKEVEEREDTRPLGREDADEVGQSSQAGV